MNQQPLDNNNHTINELPTTQVISSTSLDNTSLSNAVSSVKVKTPFFLPIHQAMPAESVLSSQSISRNELFNAALRLERWAKPLTTIFPELASTNGLIESPLFSDLPAIDKVVGTPLKGKALIKADHLLPIAGSIKARGGIYEVLAFAEKVAIADGLIDENDDLSKLITPEATAHFSNYQIGVGSTGNLGLSIGIIASKLGFNTTVHMSSDAKAWKKALLRQQGATVIEHPGDYATAVEAGRQELSGLTTAHFVDDENSLDLFLGYAVAALRLEKQLTDMNITVDSEHPLFVYLPCGVGGAPGGITWGLKQVYGDAVHCFFAEPTASPAFMVRMLSTQPTSVYNYGLDNQTEADGLAVGQASELVYQLVGELIDGCYSFDDNELFPVLTQLKQRYDLQIEPSAAAGFLGPLRMAKNGFKDDASITHLFWTTGGLFVPPEEYAQFYQRGENS